MFNFELFEHNNLIKPATIFHLQVKLLCDLHRLEDIFALVNFV